MNLQRHNPSPRTTRPLVVPGAPLAAMATPTKLVFADFIHSRDAAVALASWLSHRCGVDITCIEVLPRLLRRDVDSLPSVCVGIYPV